MESPPAAAAHDYEVQARTVDLSRVAPHPANPRTDLGDLETLTESIQAHGVLQPPIVLPAARVADTFPDRAAELGDVDWVVLMGHRRRAAAIEAGRTHLAVLVREDAIADDRLGQLDAMIAENTAREALSPVEEARAFGEQVAAGRSQRQIAGLNGCSQSHVSKRLALLQLPDELLALLDGGRGLYVEPVDQDDDEDLDDEDEDEDDDQDDAEKKAPALDIKTALTFVAGSGGDQDLMRAAYQLHRQNHWWDADDCLRHATAQRDRALKVEAARVELESENIRVLDPHATFGPDARDRRLLGEAAITTARDAGTLAGHIDAHGQISYYDTAAKKPKAADNRTPEHQQRIDNERERELAMAARAKAAVRIVANAPQLPPAARDVVDACLASASNDVRRLATKLLIAVGALGQDPDDHRWWWNLRTTGAWALKVKAAHALAVARLEVMARTATWQSWEQDDVAWLARLRTEAGYSPSPWEQARIANARPPADTESELGGDADDVDEAEMVEAAPVGGDRYAVEDLPADAAGSAAATPAVYTLMWSDLDEMWLVLHGGEDVDHNPAIGADDTDAACDWASDIVGRDYGQRPAHWQSRHGADDRLEYVAESAPGMPIIVNVY